MTIAGLLTGAALALVLLVHALSSTLLEPTGRRPSRLLSMAAAVLASAFLGLTVAQLAEFLG